ncbi:hypothetical protein GCM10010492_03510 [Saccharothrix mutabilis subsp. mutabilis]|uniref:Uncharacterized protein n=2 Tax=Saccharothrix mutabilis TaxID=33921 RepID=A0ABN0T1D8_9PSEU
MFPPAEVMRPTYAEAEELLSRNVMKLVKVPKVSRRPRKRKGRRWTTEQTKTFLVSARVNDDPMYAAYVLVIAMAMRKGEVLGLPEDAADLGAGMLDIGYQLHRVRNELLHRETKTEASEDTLPLPPIAATALRRRRKQRQADREAADVACQANGLLFTTRYGTPIEPRNFNRSWDRRREKAGVPKIRSRRAAELRVLARRAGRAPPGDHAHPSSREHEGHDRDLHRGLRRGDAKGATAAQRMSRSLTRCCTGLLAQRQRPGTNEWFRASDLRWAIQGSNL